METAWELMPICSSLASIFFAVVVLPEPEGPESRTIRDLDRLSAIFRAAGEKIRIPKFEFARQMRSDIKSQPLRLGSDEIAILPLR